MDKIYDFNEMKRVDIYQKEIIWEWVGSIWAKRFHIMTINGHYANVMLLDEKNRIIANYVVKRPLKLIFNST